ncbi:serine protease [Exilibacterium tricleocarpae]|uniref:Serine protease n=1 Tax=Exilibacterium tricleocarpae TaxID=2591008 RepID=A0A545TKA3_9GAMM|nr:serine protease [Exilibacterium tricleocarpae]
MQLIVAALLTLTCVSAMADTERQIKRLKSAVVKIYTTSAPPDYFTPWRLLNPKQSSGSGAVISGQRILTNAHVLADARYIQAQKNGDPKKYLARVAFISHEADLAILEVDDKTFFDGLRPLSLGKLPDPLQEVSVFGYPFGGNALSITKGILSRVEHQYYAHSGAFLLAGQIDAAINPGNSGGPVIVDQKIVGVVMQANTSGRAENLGYFVPPSVIRHVLKDATDGFHHGFPDLGFRTQNLESPAMKNAYNLNRDQTGALVAKVFDKSPASGRLQVNDVILAIDGFTIADDRTIEFRPDQRTNFKHAIDQYHIGDKIELTVSRHGEIKEIELTAGERLTSYSLVQNEQFDQVPRYYIYGGIVFVPLNMNLIKRWGRDWHSKAPVDFLHARNRWSSNQQRELVVALKVLAADVNLGYHDWKNWILDTINGTPIRDFQSFSELLRNNTADHVIFKDDDGYQLVIDHQQALAAEPEILELYRIPGSHSVGLFEQQAAD